MTGKCADLDSPGLIRESASAESKRDTTPQTCFQPGLFSAVERAAGRYYQRNAWCTACELRTTTPELQGPLEYLDVELGCWRHLTYS